MRTPRQALSPPTTYISLEKHPQLNQLTDRTFSNEATDSVEEDVCLVCFVLETALLVVVLVATKFCTLWSLLLLVVIKSPIVVMLLLFVAMVLLFDVIVLLFIAMVLLFDAMVLLFDAMVLLFDVMDFTSAPLLMSLPVLTDCRC